MKDLLGPGPPVGYHPDDFRDNLAGLLNDHGVADAHVKPANLVFIVQRGTLDRRASEEDRFQFRDRGECAGAADLDGDGFELRLGLVGRILEGHAPARRFGRGAKPLAQRDGIEFDDCAIGFVGKVVADFVELVDGAEQFLHRTAVPVFLRRLEPERFKPMEQLDLRRRHPPAFHFAGSIENDVELAPGDEAGVELLERAGGGIARVGEGFFAG